MIPHNRPIFDYREVQVAVLCHLTTLLSLNRGQMDKELDKIIDGVRSA